MKKLFPFLLLFVLGVFVWLPFTTKGQGQSVNPANAQAPITKFRGHGKDAIPNRYIVVLNEWVTGKTGANSYAPQAAAQITSQYHGKLHRTYKHALNGFATEMTKEDVASLLNDSRVKYVEEDAEVHLASVQSDPPSWGLSRISERQRDLPKPYSYPDSAGEGVDVYVLDSGVWADHPDFGGRARMVLNLIPTDREPPTDFSGHGTHVTGIIGSNTYGVAKKANLLSIKAMNRFGQGMMSDILLGINYVTEQAQAQPGKRVLNVSIGGPQSIAVNEAISAAYNAGVVVVTAAGNDGQDACNFSPASTFGAIVVGATDKTDTVPSWSNYGKCVTLFAPGVEIQSTWIPVPPQGTTLPDGWMDFPTVSLSGTSMAAPHVAGVAALILSQSDSLTSVDVYRLLTLNATQNVIQGLDALSPNRLLFNDENSHYTPPVVASQPVQISAGSPVTRLIIASARDAEDEEPVLSVAARPQSGVGVTVNNISVDRFGNVTADVTAACNATASTFLLRVSDSSTLVAETKLSVNVTPDAAPPDTRLTSVPAAVSGASASFSFTGTDNCTLAGFECKLDNGGWATCTSSQSYSALVNGAHTFQVRAKDATGNVDPTPATYTWQAFTATCATTVGPTSLPNPVIGLPYAQPLSASPSGNYTFSLLAGQLPPGLQLVTALGATTLAGLPTTPGTYNFTLKAKKSNANCEGARSYTVTIAPTVAPLLNCVMRNANGSYTAWFGYDNTTGAPLTIPVGANNYFTPGTQNRGQATVFQPGRVNNAFSVTFAANGSNLGVWIVKGPDGVTRPLNITTATLGCP